MRTSSEVPVGRPAIGQALVHQSEQIRALLMIGWSEREVRARMAVLETLHAAAYKIRRGIRNADPDAALIQLDRLRCQLNAL